MSAIKRYWKLLYQHHYLIKHCYRTDSLIQSTHNIILIITTIGEKKIYTQEPNYPVLLAKNSIGWLIGMYFRINIQICQLHLQNTLLFGLYSVRAIFFSSQAILVLYNIVNTICLTYLSFVSSSRPWFFFFSRSIGKNSH